MDTKPIEAKEIAAMIRDRDPETKVRTVIVRRMQRPGVVTHEERIELSRSPALERPDAK